MWTEGRTLFAILRTRLKASQLTLYKEVIFVCSQKHTQCWQNVDFCNVKPGGSYINYWNTGLNMYIVRF